MYDKECEGCKISRRDQSTVSKIRGQTVIDLKGGWILNHFSYPKETYLGRLVLQPKCHREDFGDLSIDEVASLGENLQRITKTLKDYWKKNFSPDEIQRVYIVYFWETHFAKEQPGKKYHMHIHILPRSEKMVRGQDPTTVAAWHMHELPDKYWFPSEYRIVDVDNGCERKNTNEANVKKLMNYLRRSLSKDYQ